MLRLKKTDYEAYLKRLKTNSRTGNFDNDVGTFFWLWFTSPPEND